MRPGTGRRVPGSKSRAAEAALLFVLALLVAGFAAQERARAQEAEITLPESGIRYPTGFDPNTVGEVRGTVRSLLPEPRSGPVRFQVVSQRETYTILACPGWFWSDLAPGIQEGAEVRVRGSKGLGKDGNLYLVAQEVEIVSTGRTLVLRDEDGFPLWSGPSGGMMGRHGRGAPQGGMGSGGGGGFGGRGRGGRR